jgi:hypothetical protein
MPMTLEEFDNTHGAIIRNALSVYAERMRETAEQARTDAATIDQQPAPVPAPGMISVRPSGNAMRRMAAMFDEAADKADATHKAWTDETEGPDEEDAELLGIDPDGTHHFRV